jgi:hypothetical protein
MALLLFPAVVTVLVPDLGVEDAHLLVAESVRDSIRRRFEPPSRFTLSLAVVGARRGALE